MHDVAPDVVPGFAAPGPGRTVTRPGHSRLIAALFALFILVGFVRYWNTDGEDLASSYVGCRLLATGHPEALFVYDTDNFADIGKAPLWQKLSTEGGFNGYLHPYVQTPLWGYSLEPLCSHMQFPAFSRLFCLLMMLCFAGSLWLILRFWAPHLLHPLPVALTLVLFSLCEPYLYAMFLMQTHALFFLLSVAALILAERGRPFAGGACLALAAGVKITPGFLVLYWLLTRRWKAIGSMALTSALLLGFTVLAVGPQLMRVYFADLHRISRILLVAQNNQSFAAWVMARFYPSDAVFDIDILPLPTAVRLSSTALMAATVALGGWIDARWKRPSSLPPLGAVMALVAVTIFAPIAWTHYFFILVAPVLVLLEVHRFLRAWWLVALAAAVAALNFRPLSSDVLRMDIGTLALVRSQFYAGVLALFGLLLAAWQLQRRQAALPHGPVDVH